MWDEKKVRIIDIAEELGVSTATVSNVIHGKTGRVSQKTIQIVQEKLEERGYVPNMAATLLAQNDSRIIGVVLNNHQKYEGHVLEDPFISAAVNAISDEIEQAGYFMMLKKATRVLDVVRFASMWNLDGMILLGFCADDYLKLRDQIRIPFVVYDGFFRNDRNICNLLLDDRDGGRQVGNYLLSFDHHHVLFLADNRLQPDYDRYLGLCDGLGFPADYWEIPLAHTDRDAFYESHIQDFHAYTAIFAASDYYAVEVMRFLISKGIQIPDDISIVGYDDSSLCKTVAPALTSVRQDNALRASLAMEALLSMKKDRECSITRTLPVTLTVRDSCSNARF